MENHETQTNTQAQAPASAQSDVTSSPQQQPGEAASTPVETPAYQQPENLQVDSSLPCSSRSLGTAGILGGIFGAIATVLTFRSRTASSRIKAVEKSGLVNTSGSNPLEAMTNLYESVKTLTNSTGNRVLGDEKLDKLMGKAQNRVSKLSTRYDSHYSGAKSDFVGNTGDRELRNKGAIPLLTRLATGILGIGGEAAYIGLIEGVSGKRAKRSDERFEKQATKIQAEFQKDVTKDVAKNSDQIKVGLGNHVKNGIIAVGVGAVVMGATMAVTKFIEKHREKKRAAKYAEQIQLDREIAMIAPQTQISAGSR